MIWAHFCDPQSTGFRRGLELPKGTPPAHASGSLGAMNPGLNANDRLTPQSG